MEIDRLDCVVDTPPKDGSVVSSPLRQVSANKTRIHPAPVASIPRHMRFIRHYRYVLSFLALLVFCSVMVIRGLQERQSKHVELREAMILLHTRGYTNQAAHLYTRLIQDAKELPNKVLLDDFQRTLLLVDPSTKQFRNPIWNYHWVVSNELEKRSESTLERARQLAEEN